MEIKNITKDTRRPITDEIKEFAREFEWGEFEIERGYGYFETNLFDHDGIVVHSRHIQAIGDMDVFDSDMDAALFGDKFYGEKIFHYDVDCGDGAQNLQDMWFVDEPETRKAVEDYLVRRFGPEHGFEPDYVSEERFIGKFPKIFVFQDLENGNDREVFTLGALDVEGNGYYLSAEGAFVRSVGNEVTEFDINDDGEVEYNEFALNGLYFELDSKTGMLDLNVLSALTHPTTAFFNDNMVKFAEMHLVREQGVFEAVKQHYYDSGDLRGALFLEAVAFYSEYATANVYNDFVRKHADEYIYSYENGKELIDLDFWCDYQELLGEKITYDEYVAIDKHLDGAPADYTQDDKDVVLMLREKLQEYRDKANGVDKYLIDLAALNVKYPEPREEMSPEREREFVSDCFDMMEQEGFSDKFWSPYGDYKERFGEPFTVVERCTEKTCDIHVLPMWNIQFTDGAVVGAYPEEIIPSEMKENGCPYFAEPTLEQKVEAASRRSKETNVLGLDSNSARTIDM